MPRRIDDETRIPTLQLELISAYLFRELFITVIDKR